MNASQFNNNFKNLIRDRLPAVKHDTITFLATSVGQFLYCGENNFYTITKMTSTGSELCYGYITKTENLCRLLRVKNAQQRHFIRIHQTAHGAVLPDHEGYDWQLAAFG